MHQLALLIPTLHCRAQVFAGLKTELIRQKAEHPVGTVQILEMPDNGEASIGTKRNTLMLGHKAKYHAFIDDDDMVDSNYINLLLSGIKTGADCCSLTGRYFVFDGLKFNYDRPFYHSLKYEMYHDDAAGYYRYPNHLNCVKTELVKDVLFPDKNFGEDFDWAKQVNSLERLKTEAEIPVPFYDYYFKPERFKTDLKTRVAGQRYSPLDKI